MATQIPASSDLKIIIGDDFAGATLNLSESPGTGTWETVLESSSGSMTDFVTVETNPTEILITMAQADTVLLKAGTYTWSLLFKQTSPPLDTTICVGGALVQSFPTRNK